VKRFWQFVQWSTLSACVVTVSGVLGTFGEAVVSLAARVVGFTYPPEATGFLACIITIVCLLTVILHNEF
jgi:hypothetical protein